MKKLLLLFSLITVFTKTKSQVVFCPPGAEWHYTFFYPFMGYTENEEIKYTGDMVLTNEIVKKLEHTRFFTVDNEVSNLTYITYIKQSGDTVFMKNIRTQNNWQILYNFAALPGQFWINTFNDGTPTPVHYMVTVDSVSHVTLNNVLLKRMYVTYDNDLVAWGQGISSQITERIGNNNFLFNYACHPQSTDYEYLSEFLCYRDNSFGLKQFGAKPCDFANEVGIEEQSFQNNDFIIYPNPTNGKLNLKFSTLQNTNINIKNSLGQLVYTRKGLNSDKELDLTFLPSGIYYLTIQSSSEQKTLKLIKE